MNSGTIWGRFVEKTRGKKSRATVPLCKISFENAQRLLEALTGTLKETLSPGLDSHIVSGIAG